MPEQELNDVFVRAVGDSVPDLGLLVAGATAEGRSIRLRRRLAFTGAVAAVLALAVGGGLLLRPAAAPPAVSAAAPGTGPFTDASTSTASTAFTTAQSVRTRPVLLERLLPFVPPELVLDGWEDTGTAADGPTGLSVLARFHRASGEDAGTIEVRVQQADRSVQDQAWKYDCPDDPAVLACAPIGSGDASGVNTTRSDEQGRTVYQADLLDHRGIRLVLSATGPAGDAPPLDRNAMGKIAAGVRQALSPDLDEYAARELARKRAATTATESSPPASPAPSLTLTPSARPGGDGPAAAGGSGP
ncbi:hypothetical protein ACFV6F_24940 [Kitasatospora phosalacinea]|uniref:hypothetical protein n=1 Tax=Kitasatospora phosalacinea TaxID=2065 RepID=UPI00364E78D9